MGGRKKASGRTGGKAVNDSTRRENSSKGRSESKPDVREKQAKPGNGRTTSSRGQCLVRAIALRALGFVKKHAKKFSVATLMAIVATGYPIWQDWTKRLRGCVLDVADAHYTFEERKRLLLETMQEAAGIVADVGAGQCESKTTTEIKHLGRVRACIAARSSAFAGVPIPVID